MAAAGGKDTCKALYKRKTETRESAEEIQRDPCMMVLQRYNHMTPEKAPLFFSGTPSGIGRKCAEFSLCLRVSRESRPKAMNAVRIQTESGYIQLVVCVIIGRIAAERDGNTPERSIFSCRTTRTKALTMRKKGKKGTYLRSNTPVRAARVVE